MDKLIWNGVLAGENYYQLGRKEVRVSGLDRRISYLSDLMDGNHDLIQITVRKRIDDDFINSFAEKSNKYDWLDYDESEMEKYELFQDIGFRSISEYDKVVVKIAKCNRDIERIHHELSVLSKIQDIDHVVKVLFTISRKGVIIGFAMNKLNMIEDDDCFRAYTTIKKVMLELHDRQIFHRDIRRDNIMKDGEGDFVLIDFGIAMMENGESKVENYSPEAISLLDKYNNYEEFDKLMLETLNRLHD